VVLVDTTVWIDYLEGVHTPHTEWLDAHLERQRFGLTDIILCEILQGVRGEAQAKQVHRELKKFEILTMGGEDLAAAAAANYRKLRARGCTVRKTVDCLIASFCLLNGHALLHNDRDFDPFERLLGLFVVHP